MTLQSRRKRQITAASQKWPALLSRFVRPAGIAALACIAFGFGSEEISAQSNSLRQAQPPIQQTGSPQSNQAGQGNPIEKPGDTNSYHPSIAPPVHARPIQAIAGGRKSILKSRLFDRSSETSQVQKPKRAEVIPDAQEIAPRENRFDNGAVSNHQGNDQGYAYDEANPLRHQSADYNANEFVGDQPYQIQQVVYNQDGLDWRQRGNYYPAANQQQIDTTRLQGPMQDDWNPAPANTPQYNSRPDPINDPFGDHASSGQGPQNRFQQPTNAIQPPRMLSQGQMPTPADPRTNPRHRLNQQQQPGFEQQPQEIEAYSQQGLENLMPPDDGGQQIYSQPANNYSQFTESNDGQYDSQLRQPRRVEPRRMYSPETQRNRAIPSTYRPQDAAAQDQDSASLDTDDKPMGGKGIKSCDEYRNALLNRPIYEIVVDISARRPSQGYDDVGAELSRQWRDRCGNQLAVGTFLRLERSYAIITNDQGQIQQLHLASLGDPDLAEISTNWGLPIECTLGCFNYNGRCWTPQTVTWYASSLCHKPLYFEDIQLERYGHSGGPFYQPFRSSAHFFCSLVMLPYNKRINPPNECIYALGYYRPGNCAPWLVDPFPLSREGALNMAIDYTTMSFIIP